MCRGGRCVARHCPDRDLGSATGAAVAVGVLTESTGDLAPCNASSTPAGDVTLQWTAPVAAAFTFDVCGSGYTLDVRQGGCAGESLYCAAASCAISLALFRGESVIVTIGVPFMNPAFPFQLDILACQDGTACAPANACHQGMRAGCATGVATCTDTGAPLADGTACGPGHSCRAGACLGATCPDADLGSVLGTMVASGSTVGALDDVRLTCHGSGFEDLVYMWQAPAAGRYTFSGSPLSLLGLLDGGCTGPELACSFTSTLTAELAAGQAVALVVEAFSSGVVPLAIEACVDGAACTPAPCATGVRLGCAQNQPTCVAQGTVPDGASCGSGQLCFAGRCGGAACNPISLGSATGTAVASGTTVAAANHVATGCYGDQGGDVVYTWTAPATATYVFDTCGSSFGAIGSVLDGTCTGVQRACLSCGGFQQALSMQAGQTVALVVEGLSGNAGAFQLNINACTQGSACQPANVCHVGARQCSPGIFQPQCADTGVSVADGTVCGTGKSCQAGVCLGATCPDADLGSALGNAVASGTTVGAADDVPSACGFIGGLDRAFRWTAPAAGYYTFDTCGSAVNTLVEIRDGTCSGAPLTCQTAGCTPGLGSSVNQLLSAGQSVVVVVDSTGAAGNYTLNIRACQDGTACTPQNPCHDGVLSCASVAPTCVDLRSARPDGTSCGATHSCQGGRCVGSACPEGDLGAALGGGLATGGFGSLSGDDVSLECFPSSAADRTLRWIAPSDGLYSFDLGTPAGVLGILDGSCAGTTLACVTSGGRVDRQLHAGQTIVLVIKAVLASYSLSISRCDEGAACVPANACHQGVIACANTPTCVDTGLPRADGSGCGAGLTCQQGACLGPTCPDTSIGSALGNAVVTSSLTGAVNDVPSPCSGAGAPDRVFLWTAPSTGSFVFDTCGSAADTVLNLLDRSCTGRSQLCSVGGGLGCDSRSAQATYPALAGQTVPIVVDGRTSGSSGAFALNIHRACPTGTGDCDTDPANGCETSLVTSADCGRCGQPCNNAANGTSSCVAPGVCRTTCDVGFGDCDFNAANGCERQVSSASNTAPGESLGTFDADAASNFPTCGSQPCRFLASRTGQQGRFFQVGGHEASTCSAYTALRFELVVPSGANYDLIVTGGCQCVNGAGAASCTSSGTGNERVDVFCNETGADDSFTAVAEVRYVSGGACGSWSLAVSGGGC